MVKRTKEQQDRFRITANEVDHLGISSATIEWTPENYERFKKMKAKPTKKPRKRIKARSDSLRARALREMYEEAKKTFLAYRGSCERCGKERPLEVHHIRGRTSTLLIDRRWFSGICKECHNFIHQHVKTAKAEGCIAGAGEWDCPPKDTETVRLNGLILDRINAIGERIKKKVAAKVTKEWEARVRKITKKD